MEQSAHLVYANHFPTGQRHAPSAGGADPVQRARHVARGRLRSRGCPSGRPARRPHGLRHARRRGWALVQGAHRGGGRAGRPRALILHGYPGGPRAHGGGRCHRGRPMRRPPARYRRNRHSVLCGRPACYPQRPRAGCGLRDGHGTARPWRGSAAASGAPCAPRDKRAGAAEGGCHADPGRGCPCPEPGAAAHHAAHGTRRRVGLRRGHRRALVDGRGVSPL